MQRYIYPLLLLLISVITHHVWITNLSPLVYGDTIYFNPESLNDYYQPLSLWVNSYITTGSLYISASYYPMFFLTGLLGTLGFHYGIIERLVYMWPLIILLPLGPYYLVRYLLKSEPAAFIGSLVYSYNTYTLIRNSDQLPITMSITLAPIILYFFIKALNENKLYLSIIAGFILLISGFFDFRIAYVISAIVTLYFLYHAVFFGQIGWPRLRQSTLLITPILILVLGNMYWIISVYLSNSLTRNALFDRGLFGNDYFNVLYAITLHHPFWTGATPAVFENKVVPLHFFLIPLLTFWGFMTTRNNKHVVFFGLLSVIGIFLSKQAGEPFTGAYEWLFTTIPGFNAFREASKFYFIIALGYSVLIAALSMRLLKFRFFGQIAVAGIGGLFLINSIALLTGTFGTLFVKRSMPDDYVKINKFINDQPEYFRTLWIPTGSRWGTFSQKHPMLSFDVMIQTPWKEIGRYTMTEYHAPGKLMLDTFKHPDFDLLLDMTSIRYIIVPLQDHANDDDFIQNYQIPTETYVKVLSTIPYIKRVNIGTKNAAIFENRDARPRMYLTDTHHGSHESEYRSVSLVKSNSTHYEIAIPRLTKSAYLQFTDTYDPAWRTTPELSHTKNSAGFNSFYIDSTKIKTPTNITLRFSRQSPVNLGTGISILSVCFFIVLFYYDVRKYHVGQKSKKNRR